MMWLLLTGCANIQAIADDWELLGRHELVAQPVPTPGDAAPLPPEAEELSDVPVRTEEPALFSEERARVDTLSKSKLLMKLIGTTGGSNQHLEDLWSDDQGFGDLDYALQGIGEPQVVPGPSHQRGGGDAAGIGDLGGTVGGGMGVLTE